MENVKLEATLLRSGYFVHPAGQLGTMGWHPFPWDGILIKARNESDAIRKTQAHFNEKAAKYAARNKS